MTHNEDTCVKIPALIHFIQPESQSISLKNGAHIIYKDTNIFVNIFLGAINQLNKNELTLADINKIPDALKCSLPEMI